ncbi:MAG TPA: beta-L-arabinofuranosidase domain-containing protein [Chitinophagaceae bacterium]|nr:beta-L-arabinofuranosidase domain-containing protein [Chitinophagaceae bacterium]
MKKFISLPILFFTSFLSAQSYVPQQNDTRVKVKPAVPIKAWAFDLKDVKLLDGPFHHAMKMDSAYLLVLKPDRLLYRFYKNAGLPVKDSVYGGWESEGLSGHSMGHYLSACSMMYASTRNDEFRRRVNYIVDELEKCQRARKTGYVGAIPKEDSIFGKVANGEIRSGGFDLNGGWSPWYTVHKVMAGLVDAYLYTGNKKALKVVTGMADWAYNTVNHLPDSLRLKMLNCEYGGMNNVLADIYAITGYKKYLDLSYKFHDEFVMGKLAHRIDPMPGKHSNTNIPKAIGSAREYELTGNEPDKTIASFFWETMAHHHS